MNFSFVVPVSRIWLSSPFFFWIVLLLIAFVFFSSDSDSSRSSPAHWQDKPSLSQHFFWFSESFLLLGLFFPLYLMAVSLSSPKIHCLPFTDCLLCSCCNFYLPAGTSHFHAFSCSYTMVASFKDFGSTLKLLTSF